MADESERIKEVKQYIDSTIIEIDGHTENMEKTVQNGQMEQGQRNCMESSSTHTSVTEIR